MMAKAMCPFKKNNCGNSTGFNFTDIGQQQNINVTLPQGETCTYQIQAQCGLPSFKPNDTTGFDIEVIDYDDDDLDVPAVISAKEEDRDDDEGKKKERREFGSDQRAPKPPKGIKVERGDRDEKKPPRNGTKPDEKEGEKKRGPQARRYDPGQGPEQKFKGGKKSNATEPRCKRRYQQLSVTALGDVNGTSAARILQTGGTPMYTMTLQVGSADFSASSAFTYGASLTFVILSFALSLAW